MTASFLKYRVGMLGIPNSVTRFEIQQKVPWDKTNIDRLKALGFNTIQLNLAWGSRPNDEPLNLEDVVELTPQQQKEYSQPVEYNCQPSAEHRRARQADLRQRIVLCREAGLRTIFHFGAPYNAHARFGDGPPNCISDEKVSRRHELLVDAFARDFPGVDDLLLYTYDQDAWLCSEFGPCPACLGVPLHERLVPFIARIAATWRKHSPTGRVWWEPWELSAGQVYACIERLPVEGMGLALHSNIAEVQATLAVDRWLKNAVPLASERGMPVIVEHWLGGPSEELESFQHLSHPLVTLRALKAIAAIPGVSGIKEYYGLAPDHEDPNLRMTGLFFADPTIAEDAALQTLAQPYGPAAAEIIRFWKLTSAGMEFFPWDISWYTREIGRSLTNHSLSAAFLRGQQCHTPSWDSTRAAIFMKTDNAQPHPWMLEDTQLRFGQAAERWEKALEIGLAVRPSIPKALALDFEKNLVDLTRLRRRSLAYAYHLRATNLATILRRQREANESPRPRVLNELLQVLESDRQNHLTDQSEAGTQVSWSEIDTALALLRSDVDKFLANYFREDPDQSSKGMFSVTSR